MNKSEEEAELRSRKPITSEQTASKSETLFESDDPTHTGKRTEKPNDVVLSDLHRIKKLTGTWSF